ncbi:hypothetical protein PR048_019379, partial [Dryococelus australis]
MELLWRPGHDWFKKFCVRQRSSLKNMEPIEKAKRIATGIISSYIDFMTYKKPKLKDSVLPIPCRTESPQADRRLWQRKYNCCGMLSADGKREICGPREKVTRICRGDIIHALRIRICQEWLYDYFQEFLVKFARGQKQRPILLILDGHLIYLDMKTAQFARRKDITIIKLSAHTTDVLQPLYKACFQSLRHGIERKTERKKERKKEEKKTTTFVNFFFCVRGLGRGPETRKHYIWLSVNWDLSYPIDRNKYPETRFNLDKHQIYLKSLHQPDLPSQNIPEAEHLGIPLDVPGPSQQVSSFPTTHYLKRHDAPDDSSPTPSAS